MKKLLVVFLLAIFCFSYSSAEEVKIKILIKSVTIVSPDGESNTYTDILKIPPIDYASKIISNGMGILTCCSVAIILKNQQGIFVAKNPMTRAMEFSKTENSRKGELSLFFDPNTTAAISPDGKFSLKYDEEKDMVSLEILNGTCVVKSNNAKIDLVAGDTFNHELKGRKYAF
ncbi:MAG: hypothetical protein II816_05655 [Elusimicrobia bacterium]|nr:hypothetical protein [Elusimicrobiota bacterium]